MKHKVSSVLSPSQYVVADIIDTEGGIKIEVLEKKDVYCTEQEILESFINSIREQYDTRYRGYNKKEFLEETLLPRKEKLIEELEKIKFIEKIIHKDIRRD